MIHAEAQLLDHHDTARCCTLTMSAPSLAVAEDWAKTAGKAIGMFVSMVYEIDPPDPAHSNRAKAQEGLSAS